MDKFANIYIYICIHILHAFKHVYIYIHTLFVYRILLHRAYFARCHSRCVLMCRALGCVGVLEFELLVHGSRVGTGGNTWFRLLMHDTRQACEGADFAVPCVDPRGPRFLMFRASGPKSQNRYGL